MTQQALKEKIQHEIETSVYGFCCRECNGGGANGQDKCEPCNGTGILDWNYDIATKQILQQVIEWANNCVDDTYDGGLTEKTGEVSGYGQAFIEGFREAKSQIKTNIFQLKEEYDNK